MTTTDIATKKNAVQALAQRLQVSPETLQKTLKATAFKECRTNEEFIAAVMVANTYKLNPILKEMYVFPSKGGIIPIVSIDGWIKIATSHPKFNGMTLVCNPGADKKIESVTATFWVKENEHPVVITEYMVECFQPNKDPWKKWPIRMLRHKAYIQGARLAFGFAGIYDPDEAERIAEGQDAEVHPAPEALPLPTEEPVTEPDPKVIEYATDKQIAGLNKLAKSAKMPEEGFIDLCAELEIEHPDNLTVDNYRKILKRIGELIDANSKKSLKQNAEKTPEQKHAGQ